MPIANNTVNSLAATILPDAPVDPVTGLKVPTIAVATNGGVSVIRHDGVVVNSASTWAFNSIAFDRSGLWASFSNNAYGGAHYRYQDITATSFAPYLIIYSKTQGGSTPLLPTSTWWTSISSAKDRIYVRGNNNTDVNIIKPGTRTSSTTSKPAIASITSTYNTGHLIGDIRRCFLSDITTGSVTGPELVTNGDFSSGQTGWTAAGATGWIFTNNEVQASNASGYYLGVGQFVSGKAYLCQITISNYVSGGVSFAVGGGGFGTVYQANGSFSQILILGSSGEIGFARRFSNFTGTIDNISVKEVIPDRSYKAAGANIYGTLTASAVNTGNSLVAYSGFSGSNYLQEPYSADLDFGTSEWSVGAWVNVPATLPDASFPVTGSELVTNGDFSNEATGWALGANMAVTGGSLVFTASTYNQAWQILSITSGKTYKLTFDLSVTSTDNGLRFYLGTGVGSGPVYQTATSGAKTFYIIAGGTDSHLRFRCDGTNFTGSIDNISVKEVSPALIADRAYSTGPKINLGVTYHGRLTATAYDGTTTRTVTTSAAYNTATWTKVRATYTTDGTLSLMVNGVNVASTTGTPLLTLNNSSAVLTIGNSYALDAPFPGSISLLKLSATVPTQEQATWMYEQEKHLFAAGAQCVLPSSGNVLDLAYDDETDTWSALQATHESTWSGLVRTSTQTPSAGSFAKAAATSGIKLLSRTTTNPGVDVQIPSKNLKAELTRKREALNANQDVVVFDYFGGFTATTTTGSTALTSVASSLYPITTNLIGCAISGTGIPASTVITGISGTTIYMSKAATANGSTIQISTTDFNLPVGYTARAVMTAGTLKREGSTADYVKNFDGFRETIRYAVAPGYNAWISIQAVKEVV